MFETRRSIPVQAALTLFTLMLLSCTAVQQSKTAAQPRASGREVAITEVGTQACTEALPPVVATPPHSISGVAPHANDTAFKGATVRVPRTLKGTVIDSATGTPLAGAQVQVLNTNTFAFSEADGTFAIEDAMAGAVKLEVGAPEYEWSVVDVPAGLDVITIPLVLVKGEQIVVQCAGAVIHPRPRIIRGSVVDQTGAPIVGAEIQVLNTSTVLFSHVDGSFVTDEVTGAAQLVVTASEYGTSVVDVPAHLDTVSIHLALKNGGQTIIPSEQPE